MQKEQNILLVVTFEDQDIQTLTHCHFKNHMTQDEKIHLIQALVNSVEDLLKDGIKDNKIIRLDNQFRTKA